MKRSELNECHKDQAEVLVDFVIQYELFGTAVVSRDQLLSHKDYESKKTAILAEWEENKYKSARRTEYPNITEQLDLLYKDLVAGKVDATGEWAKAIKKVKDDNPKNPKS